MEPNVQGDRNIRYDGDSSAYGYSGVNAEFENQPNKDEVQYEAKFEVKEEVKDRGEQAVKKEELMSHAQNQEAHDPFSLAELPYTPPIQTGCLGRFEVFGSALLRRDGQMSLSIPASYDVQVWQAEDGTRRVIMRNRRTDRVELDVAPAQIKIRAAVGPRRREYVFESAFDSPGRKICTCWEFEFGDGFLWQFERLVLEGGAIQT